MSDLELEKLIDEMTAQVKSGADTSSWQKNRKVAPLLSLISNLNNFPKATLDEPNLDRVRAQLMERISVPVATKQASWTRMIPSILRISIGAVASLLIVVSLGMGTAVAAEQSLPGQAIYPLKKIVENIQLRLTPKNEVASLQLQFANNRLDEVQQVIDQNQEGKISNAQTQIIVAQTMQDFKQTTSDAAKTVVQQPAAISQFADLSNKLQAASVSSEGEVKVQLEQALQATAQSQQQAIQNMEIAGLKVDTQPIIIPDTVTASGAITAVTHDSITIGTSEFLLTSDTQYFNIQQPGLKVGLSVDVQGVVKDNKTYATQINVADPSGNSASTSQSSGSTSGTSTTQTNTDQTKQETQTIPPASQDLITIPDTPATQ